MVIDTATRSAKLGASLKKLKMTEWAVRFEKQFMSQTKPMNF